MILLIVMLSPFIAPAQFDPVVPYTMPEISPFLRNYLNNPSVYWNYSNNVAYKKVVVRSEAAIEAMRRDAEQMLMAEVMSFYDKQRKYPDPVTDGWHQVVAMNYYDLCEDAKVRVENNQVVYYVTDDWQFHNFTGISPVDDCKATIRMSFKKKKEQKKARPIDLYFIEYLVDPASSATPPVPAGTISFWAGGDVSGGIIQVFINSIPKGDFFPVMAGISPECGEDNTLTFDYKSGTHEYRAINNRNVWRGTFTLSPGDCRLIILSPKNNTKSGNFK